MKFELPACLPASDRRAQPAARASMGAHSANATLTGRPTRKAKLVPHKLARPKLRGFERFDSFSNRAVCIVRMPTPIPLSAHAGEVHLANTGLHFPTSMMSPASLWESRHHDTGMLRKQLHTAIQ